MAYNTENLRDSTIIREARNAVKLLKVFGHDIQWKCTEQLIERYEELRFRMDSLEK